MVCISFNLNCVCPLNFEKKLGLLSSNNSDMRLYENPHSTILAFNLFEFITHLPKTLLFVKNNYILHVIPYFFNTKSKENVIFFIFFID